MDEYLLQGIAEEIGAELYEPHRARPEQEVLTKENLQDLRSAVNELKPLLDEDTYDELKMDLGEIADDLKFHNSKRGKYVIAIHNWYEPFRQEFNAMPEFAKVAIGGHAERQVVFATGVVAEQADFDKLLSYIASKNPPFPVDTAVHLGDAKGPRAAAS